MDAVTCTCALGDTCASRVLLLRTGAFLTLAAIDSGTPSHMYRPLACGATVSAALMAAALYARSMRLTFFPVVCFCNCDCSPTTNECKLLRT